MYCGIVVCWLLTVGLVRGKEEYEVEFCERETFEAECPVNHIILMKSARFGRMRPNRCVNTGAGQIGCQKDVLPQLDSWCSASRTCSFAVSVLHSTKACMSDYISYVEANYDCIETSTCEESTCQTSSHLRATGKSGTLSSAVTQESGCGSSRCPWLLQAEPGQSFNFTLYHFPESMNTNLYERSNRGTMSRNCHRAAVVKTLHGFDTDAGDSVEREVTICNDTPRISSFTIPGQSVLQVEVLSSYLLTNQPRFILSYKVYGCPIIEAPAGSSVKHNGNTLTISCDSSDKAWHLTCAGDAWVGQYDRCDTNGNKGGGKTGEGEMTSPQNMPTSRSALVLVICIGLMIGIIFGVCLLGLVMYYYKRRHNHRRQGMGYRENNATPSTPDFHRCEKHGQMYSESPYQCTHTLPSHYTLSRPDLCMQGFRPVPEGDAMTSDGCLHDSDDVITHNMINKIKCYEHERTNLVHNERSPVNTLCSSFKPNDRENNSAL